MMPNNPSKENPVTPKEVKEYLPPERSIQEYVFQHIPRINEMLTYRQHRLSLEKTERYGFLWLKTRTKRPCIILQFGDMFPDIELWRIKRDEMEGCNEYHLDIKWMKEIAERLVEIYDGRRWDVEYKICLILERYEENLISTFTFYETR